MAEFKWYALHTQVGYEEKVKEMLRNKIKDEGLSEFVEEIFVPIEEIIEIKGSKKEKVKKCLYPSYIFIKAEIVEKLYNVIRRMSYISGFVGPKNDPTPMDDSEMDTIFKKVESSKEQPRLSISFEHGETVRVLDGPFVNFTGSVDEVDIDKGRLKILVSIFGRFTPVELNYNQVEKVE